MLGSLVSAEFTPAGDGAEAITLNNIVSGSVQPGVSINEQFYNSPWPEITLGNASLVFTAVVTDNVVGKIIQGQRVNDITWKFGGVGTDINPNSMEITGAETTSLEIYASTGVISEVLEASADNSGDKAPSQTTITIRVTRDKAGEDGKPTITHTWVEPGADGGDGGDGGTGV